MTAEPRPTGELAALAASLRQNLEHAARSEPVDAATVDARFLRRLVGALNAYETAHEILAMPERDACPGNGSPSALRRQECPTCGGGEFEAVGGGWVVHLICRRCGECSRAARRGLVSTDASVCPGCDRSGVCPNRRPGR